jgi:succinate dehydrogenase / fumarate reductase iron-sulfur subunit
MREIVYKVQRFDGKESYLQEYRIAYEANKTVLWGLIAIKEKADPSLSFVAACRCAVCGACAVRVNGQAVLACEAPLDEMLRRFGDELFIQPINNFKVIRDLVVDWQPKAERLAGVRPWLIPDAAFSADTGCRQTTAEFKRINTQANCILCGACASECNKLTTDPTDFYEPFVYTKANKFVADSRDGSPLAHLQPAIENGAWKCMHCEECATKCPKGVAPVEDIAGLKQAAFRLGLTNSIGARHARAFYEDIAATGRLDEAKLALRSEGFVKSVLRLPFALRLLRRGKLSLAAPAPVKGIEQIRLILKAAKEVAE